MAAENFDRALSLVLRHEGGYVNHPADPGGATMKGVTQRVYDAYRQSHGLHRLAVQHIGMDELKDIYRRQYWNAVHGDDLPGGLDYCVFDAAVNSGPSRAVKWLQASIGVKADGAFGLVTMQAVRLANVESAIIQLCNIRLSFVQTLKSWRVFGRGWRTRIQGVRASAVAMMRPESKAA